MKYVTHSAEETRHVAAEVAAQLRGGEFLALVGDLGAGKTTFTQGLVAALGSSARVKSPTFTVMNEYVVDRHPTVQRVVHIDFYRFTTEAEVRALELETYRRSNIVIVAEWPNALPTVDWGVTREIHIAQGEGDERMIEVS